MKLEHLGREYPRSFLLPSLRPALLLVVERVGFCGGRGRRILEAGRKREGGKERGMEGRREGRGKESFKLPGRSTYCEGG